MIELTKLQFLVVDDLAAMRQVATSQLRALGVGKIHHASNGMEALQLLIRQRVDLILCDWHMPVMDGLALLDEMRKDSRLSEIPLVLVTAEVARDKVQHAVKQGVSDLLVKPYTAKRLEDKVLGALRRASAQTVTSVAQVSQEGPVAAQKPTILVVDDAPENLRLIAHLFEDQYRVRVADNGKKALAICTADVPPDLVLLDVMMPDMDGFEVARQMRQHPNSEMIPVIFVTALSDDQARRRGYDLGAVDFVSKPLDPDILRIRVGNFIRYVEMHKQRQHEYDTMLAHARMWKDIERLLREDIHGPIADAPQLIRQLTNTGSLTPQQQELITKLEQGSSQSLNALTSAMQLF
jgi:two-component system sensor histidine kinase/response regulator